MSPIDKFKESKYVIFIWTSNNSNEHRLSWEAKSRSAGQKTPYHIKVKLALEQAMKAYRGNKGIALLFL